MNENDRMNNKLPEFDIITENEGVIRFKTKDGHIELDCRSDDCNHLRVHEGDTTDYLHIDDLQKFINMLQAMCDRRDESHILYID